MSSRGKEMIKPGGLPSEATVGLCPVKDYWYK
jgi:hypothetical protein